ncbi:hypothetical protein VTO73DRAFT_2500 [Trametes versicolor]
MPRMVTDTHRLFRRTTALAVPYFWSRFGSFARPCAALSSHASFGVRGIILHARLSEARWPHAGFPSVLSGMSYLSSPSWQSYSFPCAQNPPYVTLAVLLLLEWNRTLLQRTQHSLQRR